MARRKSSNNSMMTLLVVCIIAVVALVGWLVIGGIPTSVVPDGGTGGGLPVDGSNCPDTLATAFEADCLNKLNSSNSEYLACALKLVPDSDFSQYKSYTANSSSARTASVNLKCGHDYVAYGTATQDTVNSFEPVSLGVVEGLTEPRVFQGTKFSGLKASAYDNLNKAFVYDGNDTTANDQDNLPINFTSTTNNATATALGVGTILDWSYTISTKSSIGQFGDADVGIFVAVDADKSDYDTPTIWFDGQMLSDVKGTGALSGNDEAVLSAYEYLYRIPDNIRTQPRTLRLYVTGKSGVDPDVDIRLRFCAKGYYVAADGYTIRKDCFNEATSSEIATSEAETIINEIS